MTCHQRQPIIFVVDSELSMNEDVHRTLLDLPSTITRFAGCAECFHALKKGETCDLVIAEMSQPEANALELVAEVKKILPLLPVILISGFGNIPLAVKAMKMGATDFFEKPVTRELLLPAVHAALSQGPYTNGMMSQSLTKSEIKILKLVADGKSNSEIAYCLDRSIRTVEYHRNRLMHKLCVDSPAGLTKRAIMLGLTTP